MSTANPAIHIPPNLRKALAQQAARAGEDISAVITRILKQYVQKHADEEPGFTKAEIARLDKLARQAEQDVAAGTCVLSRSKEEDRAYFASIR